MPYRNIYVPEITFPPAINTLIRKKLIDPKVKVFFQVRKIHAAEEFRASNCVSDLDFSDHQRLTIKYFYKELLVNLKKENGVINSIYYIISHDRKLATLKCEETGLLYNQLCLGERPILYMIYFDLQDLLDVVRANAQDIGI